METTKFLKQMLQFHEMKSQYKKCHESINEQFFLLRAIQHAPKKYNYFNLLSIAHFLQNKLRIRDIFSQIGWIVSESQTNF